MNVMKERKKLLNYSVNRLKADLFKSQRLEQPTDKIQYNQQFYSNISSRLNQKCTDLCKATVLIVDDQDFNLIALEGMFV